MHHLHNYTVSSPMTEHQFTQLYHIMTDAFPPIERRSFEGQWQLLDNKHYHIYTYEKQKDIHAFLAVWQFDSFWFVENFAVDSHLRGGGIGANMLQALKNMTDLPILLETEVTGYNDMADRRIDFYQRLGFHLNTFDYEQPPLQAGFQALPLHIMSYPLSLSLKEFQPFHNTLLKHVYKIKHPLQ